MSDKKRAVKAVMFGTLSGITVTIILMCLMALGILTGGLLPDEILEYTVTAVFAAGAFAGGFVATKINKGAGLVIGAITGGVMFVIVTIGALSKSTEAVSILTLIKLISSVTAGGLGGILGLKERKHISI